MLRLELFINEGMMVRLYGPLRARVAEGQVMVLGAIFNRGDEFIVSRFRSYAAKALVDSRLQVVLEDGGSVERPAAGEEPLDRWVSSVDRLLARGCRGFMVLGQVDSGKSSISALIANRALLHGYKPGVVDADVGQADVGRPVACPQPGSAGSCSGSASSRPSVSGSWATLRLSVLRGGYRRP